MESKIAKREASIIEHCGHMQENSEVFQNHDEILVAAKGSEQVLEYISVLRSLVHQLSPSFQVSKMVVYAGNTPEMVAKWLHQRVEGT